MKHVLALLACVSVAFGQASQSLTDGSASTSGTIKNWTVTYGAAYYEPGGGGYGTTPLSGYTGELNKPGGVQTSLWSSYGDVSTAIASFSGSGTFLVPVGETWIYRVYTRPKDGSWTYSDTTIVGTATSGKKFRFAYSNTSDYSKEIMILKDGTQYGSTFTVAAGASLIQTLDNLPDGSYSVVERVVGFVKSTESETWTASTGTVTAVKTTSVPDAKVFPDSHTFSDADTVGVTPATPPAAPSSAVNPSGSVWKTPAGNVTTDGLTNAVFREGIDKITTRQDELNKFNKDALADAATKKAAWEANTEASIKSMVADKITAVTSNIVGTMGNTTVSNGATFSGGSSMTIALAGTGQTVDLAPWASTSYIADLTGIIKAVIAAFICFKYTKWILEGVRLNMGIATVSPQAKGNTVAGTGGQVTALLAAGVLLFFLLTLPVGLIALADTGLGFKTNTAFFAPLQSHAMGRIGYDILFTLFPVDTFIAALSGQLVFLIAGTGLLYGLTWGLKFVVPAVVLYLAIQTQDLRADITVINFSGADVLFEDAVGAQTVTGLTTNGAVLYRGESLFFVTTGGTTVTQFELLDEARVFVDGNSKATVVYPASAWWVYVAKGFAAGCLFQLAGLGVRLLGRVAESNETL